MDKVAKYREYIQTLLSSYASNDVSDSPVPRSPSTFVQKHKGLPINLEGEAFGFRNSGLLSSIVARMLTLVPRYRFANAPTSIKSRSHILYVAGCHFIGVELGRCDRIVCVARSRFSSV